MMFFLPKFKQKNIFGYLIFVVLLVFNCQTKAQPACQKDLFKAGQELLDSVSQIFNGPNPSKMNGDVAIIKWVQKHAVGLACCQKIDAKFGIDENFKKLQANFCDHLKNGKSVDEAVKKQLENGKSVDVSAKKVENKAIKLMENADFKQIFHENIQKVQTNTFLDKQNKKKMAKLMEHFVQGINIFVEALKVKNQLPFTNTNKKIGQQKRVVAAQHRRQKRMGIKGKGGGGGVGNTDARGRGGTTDIEGGARGREGGTDIEGGARGREGGTDIEGGARGRGGTTDIEGGARGRGGTTDIEEGARERGGTTDIEGRGRGGTTDIEGGARGRGGTTDIEGGARGRGGTTDIEGRAREKGETTKTEKRGGKIDFEVGGGVGSMHIEGGGVGIMHIERGGAGVESMHIEEGGVGSMHIEEGGVGIMHIEKGGAGVESMHIEGGGGVGSMHAEKGGARVESMHIEGGGVGSMHIEGGGVGSMHIEGGGLGCMHIEGGGVGCMHIEGGGVGSTEIVEEGVRSDFTESTDIERGRRSERVGGVRVGYIDIERGGAGVRVEHIRLGHVDIEEGGGGVRSMQIEQRGDRRREGVRIGGREVENTEIGRVQPQKMACFRIVLFATFLLGLAIYQGIFLFNDHQTIHVMVVVVSAIGFLLYVYFFFWNCI